MLVFNPAEGSQQLALLALLPGGVDPVDPVLPRLPQDPEPAHLPQPGGPLGAHQPASPDGGGEEAQAQLLMHHHQVPLQHQQLRAGLQRSDGSGEERLTLQTKNGDVCKEPSNSAFMDKSHSRLSWSPDAGLNTVSL